MNLRRCLFVLLWLPLPVLAAEETANPAPIFWQDEPLDVRIEAPFKKVLGSRGDDAEYFPANLFYTADDGSEVAVPLRIKTRGNNRNRPEICRFPPLMLNFARREVGATVFAGEDRLKLVTHCQPSNQYPQYVLLEYLSYRVLNLLTDYSLRVRLLNVSYFNDGGDKPVASKHGFLIEDIERFAERMSLKEVQVKRLERDWYDAEQEVLVALFQFMISNTDWSLVIGEPDETCCHNLFALQGDKTALLPIPYDFDVTGIVNPRYGLAAHQLGQRRLTERLYRGACPDPAMLAQAIALFVEKRAAIGALYEQEPGLSDTHRKRALAYIASFYDVITDDAQVHTTIMDTCV